ncbi:MFS transporter [Vibrio sp. WJH972]
MKKLTHYSRIITAICLSSVVTFANIYWLQPLLPVIQQEFNIEPLSANLAMSAPLLGMGIGLLFFASWSDAIGRCRILIGGIALGILVSLLLPFVHDYSLFLILRFAQGLLLAACPAVAVPLLGDELRKSWLPSAVGFYIASNTLGGICSRLIGGVTAEHLGGWQSAGWIIAGITSLCFMVIVWLLPNQKHFTPIKFHLKPSVQAFGQHLARPQLLLIYLMIGLTFGCFVNLSNYLMMILEEAPYHMTSDLRSMMFLTLLGGTTSSSLVGKFTKNHSLISGVVTGIAVMFAANLLMTGGQIQLLIIGMILTSVGFFFCHAQASTLVGKSVKKAKGSAQALYSLFYYSGASLGVFVIEPLYQLWGWQGVLSSMRVALGLACLLMFIYYILTKKQLKKNTEQTQISY